MLGGKKPVSFDISNVEEISVNVAIVTLKIKLHKLFHHQYAKKQQL